MGRLDVRGALVQDGRMALSPQLQTILVDTTVALVRQIGVFVNLALSLYILHVVGFFTWLGVGQ